MCEDFHSSSLNGCFKTLCTCQLCDCDFYCSFFPTYAGSSCGLDYVTWFARISIATSIVDGCELLVPSSPLLYWRREVILKTFANAVRISQVCHHPKNVSSNSSWLLNFTISFFAWFLTTVLISRLYVNSTDAYFLHCTYQPFKGSCRWTRYV